MFHVAKRLKVGHYTGQRMSRRLEYEMNQGQAPSSASGPVATKHKIALYNCILGALSENAETRRIAEDRIKVLEITEDFGVNLIDFSLQKDVPFSVRQMSSVLLKQYIDAHWHADNGDHLLTSFVTRSRIRKQLFGGLKDFHSKIRNAFAYCISYIGSMDWPTQWPSMFDELNTLLTEDSESSALGVVQVFEDLVRECDHRKVAEIAGLLTDQLCVVLENEEKYKINIRMEAVNVLSLIVGCYSVGQEQIREAIVSKLPALCELFISNLQTEDKIICDYGLKTNIIKFLTLLIQKMSKSFAGFLNLILPTVWGMVMNYGQIYTKSVIYAKMFLTELEDDEGKVIGFTPLVLAIFDFIHSIVDCSRLNRLLSDVLPDILYYDIVFMQITKKMEESWLSDPVTFVEDDTNDCFDTTVRVTARDVLTMICQDFETELVIPALCHALNRHLTDAESTKQSGSCHWWKVHEVCMFALGLAKDAVIATYKNGTLPFDLNLYIQHWQVNFQHPELPLLLGRCLWFSGKYSHVLPPPHFNNYMQTTLSYLRHNDIILRVFAIRTIIAHCEQYDENPNKNLFIMSLPPILDSLMENLSTNQYFLYLFLLSLSTLRIILTIEKPYAVTVSPRIVPLIINLFLRHNSDPEIVHEIRQILKELCVNIGCIIGVQEKFVPILATILNTSSERAPPGLQAVAMDIMQTLVKCSRTPLTEMLLMVGFPAVVKCIIRCEDYMVMLNGGECLRSFLLLGAEQVCNYTEAEVTGLEYIMRATNHLLDPVHSEEACRRIGRLIITLINKAGSMLGSSMYFLLRAILSKMQRVDHLEVWQSLLIVFVYLFYTQLDPVIGFLTSIPGPTGDSALEFVLVEWLNRESYFHGYYERIVNVVGLSKVLEYAVTSNDTRFENIMVRDEFISKVTETHKQQGWTKIPFLGKAFKIILNEMAYQLETNATHSHTQPEENEEDSDSDETITSQLSDYMHFDTDPDQHDMLYAQDPIFQIDVLTHLTDFIHKFKTVPRFQWYISYLSRKEKQTLASMGIFVQ